ncbi:MAG: hypothetical protein V4819_06065 [Verrucomicrobiota bacterium]
MKTHTTIKHVATLLSAAFLLALPGGAAQNFNKTYSYSTGDSNFGASASFNAFDNSIPPTATTVGSYSLTAGGSVRGKIFGGSVTALSGNGTVKVLSTGTGSFTGTLSALGTSVVNVSNRPLPYVSSHYVKQWSASKSIPFSIAFIPFNVTAKVTASVDAFFRVDTTSTTVPGGAVPRVAMTIGPVADLAATASASVGVGVDGFASLSAGASGSLKLGKAALAANATIFPTFPLLTTTRVTTVPLLTAVTFPITRETTALFPTKGANVTVSLTASTSGITGSLAVFAKAELFPFGSKTVSKTIASYSTGPASANLLGPVTYKWF